MRSTICIYTYLLYVHCIGHFSALTFHALSLYVNDLGQSYLVLSIYSGIEVYYLNMLTIITNF